MWDKNWRDDLWSKIDQPWDIVIIGGGITGAGILKEARKLGLKVLLVEQRDFSWGHQADLQSWFTAVCAI